MIHSSSYQNKLIVAFSIVTDDNITGGNKLVHDKAWWLKVLHKVMFVLLWLLRMSNNAKDHKWAILVSYYGDNQSCAQTYILSSSLSPAQVFHMHPVALSLRLYPCGSIPAALSLRLYPCGSIPVALSLRLYPCGSIPVALSLWLYPCGSIHAALSPAALSLWLYPCSSIPACGFIPAALSLWLYPCGSILAALSMQPCPKNSVWHFQWKHWGLIIKCIGMLLHQSDCSEKFICHHK